MTFHNEFDIKCLGYFWVHFPAQSKTIEKVAFTNTNHFDKAPIRRRKTH